MYLTSKCDASPEPAQSARRKLVESTPLNLVTFPTDIENDKVLRIVHNTLSVEVNFHKISKDIDLF